MRDYICEGTYVMVCVLWLVWGVAEGEGVCL